MGQHSKPPSRVPQQAAAAAVAVAVGGLTVSDTGSFTAVSPADTTITSPVGIPAVVPVQELPTQELPPVEPPAAPEQAVTAAALPEPLTTPAPPPPLVAPAPPTEVAVRRGDTLTSIATAHGQSWQDLWRRNQDAVSDPNRLREGQVLSLVAPMGPWPPPQPAPSAPARTEAPDRSSASDAPAPEVEEEAPALGLSGVVNIAETFFGTPYRWGGKSASAVDCSGLVYLVLKKAGLTNTYRTSGALRDWAIPISKSEARPGDLVFGPGHVGIYAGNGMMIDAPRPGKKVGLRKVYSHMTSYGRIPT